MAKIEPHTVDVSVVGAEAVAELLSGVAGQMAAVVRENSRLAAQLKLAENQNVLMATLEEQRRFNKSLREENERLRAVEGLTKDLLRNMFDHDALIGALERVLDTPLPWRCKEGDHGALRWPLQRL